MSVTQAPTPKEMQLKSWTGVAPGWRKHDATLVKGATPASEKLLELAGVRAGSRVLDIASGTGEPAIPAARRVGPAGSVLGTDFVEPMLAFAREKASAAGLGNVEFRRVDGETLDVPAGTFDAVTIRWGLMFMPDAVACLRGAHRALKPGGKIAVACWAGPERNPWAAVPMGVLMKHTGMPKPDPGALGVFTYADPERLKSVLVEGGFKDVVVESVDLSMFDFDSFADYWTYTREMVGPVASMLEKVTPAERASFENDLAAEVAKLSPGGKVALRGRPGSRPARSSLLRVPRRVKTRGRS
jgi:ubiquinone/menaquinone biosynthesis C-methylase UbiE